MEITRNVIADLLPLYDSKECSPDTKQLVEDFLKADPGFAKQVQSKRPYPSFAVEHLRKSDEMKALRKAKKVLRIQGSIMALAIFFSLAPFSVFRFEGNTHWLLLESPLAAGTYGGIGICLWIVYFVVRRRKRVL